MNLIINGNKVKEEINIPYNLIEEKQKEFLEKLKSFNIDEIDYDKLEEKEQEKLEESFNEYYNWKKENFTNYFSPYILAFYLKDYFKVTDDEIKVDVTKYYLKDEDYDKLKKMDRDFFIKVEGEYSENYIDKQLNWLYFNSSGSTFYGHKKETGTSDYNEFKKGNLYILDGILR